MSKTLVIAEKPSVAQDIVRALTPVAGKFDCPGPPYKWTGTSCRLRRPAPCLGEHNEKVYRQELGLTKDDLAALKLSGVI